jgi:hypothetical protein
MQHGETPLALGRRRGVWLGTEQSTQSPERIRKAAASHGHRRLIIVGGDQFGHLMRFVHTLHQGGRNHVVLANANQ